MKSIGQTHNEILEFMMKNHDITKFETFDKYIEFQYDYLVTEYPELVDYGKKEFVNAVLGTLNSNNIEEFDYKKSVDKNLSNARNLKVITDSFYSAAIRILNDPSVDGDNIEGAIRGLTAANQYEKDSIDYALDVATYSRSFWQSSGLGKRNWVVWGSDLWGGFVAGTLTGTLTANPVVGFLAGAAGSELMSACVAAAQGHH